MALQSSAGPEPLIPPLSLNSWRSLSRYLLCVFFIAVVYFAAAKIGLSWASAIRQVTAIWPPTGIALIAMLLLGARVWPGVFLGSLAVNTMIAEPAGVALAIACGNTLTGILGFRGLRALQFDGSLERGRDVLALVAVAVLSPLVCATLGTLALWSSGLTLPAHSTLAIWFLWWLGSSLGIVMLAPLVLTWYRNPYLLWSGRRFWEFLAFLLMLIVTGLIAFDLPRTSIPFPTSPSRCWSGQDCGWAQGRLRLEPVCSRYWHYGERSMRWGRLQSALRMSDYRGWMLSSA